jgi:hypothetical protein
VTRVDLVAEGTDVGRFERQFRDDSYAVIALTDFSNLATVSIRSRTELMFQVVRVNFMFAGEAGEQARENFRSLLAFCRESRSTRFSALLRAG